MSEWDRIVEERAQEENARKNTVIINRILQGKRTPTRADAVEKMREKYSKYGKRRKNERLLSNVCISEANH